MDHYMRRLVRKPDRDMQSTIPTLRPIDLNSSEIKSDLNSLRAAGGAQILSVGLYRYPEEPQMLEIRDPDLPLPKFHSAEGSVIYQVGSCTKCVIAIAILRLIKETRNDDNEHKVELTQSALPLYYRWRRRRFPNDTRGFVDLKSTPNIKSLMMNMNGFDDLNDILFAPTRDFIMPEEGFLEAVVRLTNERNGDEEREPFEYSNVNYIFLGMLIEVVKNKPLAVALQELVFDELGMKETKLDLEGVKMLQTTHNFATGRLISSDGTVEPTPAFYLLDNTIQSASMGLRSSVRDLLILTVAILKAPERGEDFLNKAEVKPFWKGKPVTPFGLRSILEKEGLLSESYVRNILPEQAEFWKTKAIKDEDTILHAFHKAGYVAGFGSGIVLFPQQITSLVVLSDATGTLDVTEWVVNYLLQRLLPIPPLRDILNEALESQRRVRKHLAEIEAESTPSTTDLRLAKDIAGVYQHHLCSQKIAITDTGLAQIYHVDSAKSREMPVVYVNVNRIRLLPGVPLSLERWGKWRNVDFDVHRTPGGCYLTRVGQERNHRYERIG